MRSRRPHAARAAALVLACALAGCSENGEPNGESTWSPTSTPEQPSTSPAGSEEPPSLPAAATKATKAGARAFITHYWDVLNYAQRSGDVSMLRALSASPCSVCNAFRRDLREHYRIGGRIIGGEHSIQVAEVTELTTPSSSAYAYRFRLLVSHDSQTVIMSDGTRDERKAGSTKFTAYVHWVKATRWRLDAMEVE
ncbi:MULTISPECIES: DUF6318 family protein [Nocardioides]|uniref:DUF6318 family protein n=1 Tax=Nocardioides vastitatis TaxID=2568655 RepID=A0ABW0ZEX3_9ACTN|nr:DUF6318 family protein [Nocardioides sp.]THJ05123.1 hypothetical protein E7Z54_07755 [Nocardioides sp.]